MHTASSSGRTISASVEGLGEPRAMLVLRDIIHATSASCSPELRGGIATNILAMRRSVSAAIPRFPDAILEDTKGWNVDSHGQAMLVGSSGSRRAVSPG